MSEGLLEVSLQLHRYIPISSGIHVHAYLSYPFEGMLSRFIAHPEVRGDATRLLKALFGDSLLMVEDFMDVEPGWRIPLHLWCEETRSFDWETPLRELGRNLNACKKWGDIQKNGRKRDSRRHPITSLGSFRLDSSIG